MSGTCRRREFVQTAAAASAALGLGGLEFLNLLPPARADDARSEGDGSPSADQVDVLVRLLEDTPRERLLEEVAAKIRGGASYRQWLAALLLAGVRNIQPRPSVGFKFHAVLVVNSVHLAAMASPEQDRWLPLFWGLDYFKEAQASDVREGDWTMGPPRKASLPAGDQPAGAFVRAMESWDEEAADTAIAALVRATSEAESQRLFELFYFPGARDFRSIGHKAIYVAQAQRALQFIGWRHAEPVLRSLAYALLMHEDGNPAERDAEADRPGRRNAEIVQQIQGDLGGGRIDRGATADLLGTLREGSSSDAADAVIRQLNAGVSVQSVWDALFCGAGELLLRQPGIVSLHAATTSNAVHYAFRTSGDERTRKLLLLQNTSFLPMFREAMRGRGGVAEQKIEQLVPGQTADGASGVEEIFAAVPSGRMTAAEKTLGYLERGGDPGPLLAAGRHLLLLKGNDAHDYKFGSAALEDYAAVSPEWRGRYLAACMLQLCGAGEGDSSLVRRTRTVLQG